MKGITISTVALVAGSIFVSSATPAHAMSKSRFVTDVKMVEKAVAPVLTDVEEMALNVAIIFAQSNPLFAPVLSALGISDATDLINLVNNSLNGSSFTAVIAHFAISYGEQNPQVAGTLNSLGIQNFAQAQTALATPTGSGTQSALYELAYEFVSLDPAFASWLTSMGITGPSSIASVATNGAPSTNLMSILVSIGVSFVEDLVSMVTSATNLFPTLHLGAYQGLPLSEIAKITARLKAL